MSIKKDTTKDDLAIVLEFQRNEITEYLVYKSLAASLRGKNKDILDRIALDELSHYEIWKSYSFQDVKPDKRKKFFYLLLAKILGISFALKLMERNEEIAEQKYRDKIQKFKNVEPILQDEMRHEVLLLSLIEENQVKYIGSIILGLNDALVELSGTLAGLTFALRNSKLVGLVGVITGIAAAMSMASAEYLSQRSEHEERDNPFWAAVFTGITYISTVFILVLPYFILPSYIWAFVWSGVNGFLAIIIFSFFVSVVKDKSFKETALEMLGINITVIIISFIVGVIVRRFIGVDL